VPKQAPERLAPLGVRPELIPWFQKRWPRDVAVALRVLQELLGVDVATSRMNGVREWLAMNLRAAADGRVQ
jgi:hypothetical protein